MRSDYYCFGEILWDCLPAGRHAGGAPFNVAAHLVQLGASASLISSVGRDELGDEILQVARDKGVDVSLLTRARTGLPTGTVQVTIDAEGNATYEIVQPVAWDEIALPDGALAGIAEAKGFIFGSLAGRSPANLAQLRKILSVAGPLRFFDVNLRAPFDDLARVVEFAQPADVLKLNDDEAGRLANWLRNGDPQGARPESAEAVAAVCAIIADATSTSRICVTRGPAGAALWDGGKLLTAAAPKVTVRDTVGAGDSFTAGLMAGLTRGMDPQTTIANACQIGAFVASHHGATPLLPAELKALFATNSSSSEH